MKTLPGGAPLQNRLRPYLLPIVIGLIILVAVLYIFYNLGVDKGRSDANTERDSFYQARIAQLVTSPTPGPNGTPATSSTARPNSTTTSSIARVDKIEGNKLTLQLVSPSGAPTGSTLILTLGANSLIWKSVNSQPGELKTGDNVVFVADKDNADGSLDTRSVIILPPNR